MATTNIVYVQAFTCTEVYAHILYTWTKEYRPTEKNKQQQDTKKQEKDWCLGTMLTNGIDLHKELTSLQTDKGYKVQTNDNAKVWARMHGVRGVHWIGEHKVEVQRGQTTLEAPQVLQNLISSWMVTHTLHSYATLGWLQNLLSGSQNNSWVPSGRTTC